MKLKKYSVEQLKIAVASSLTKREILQKLNIIAAGGNYETLTKALIYFNIDSSHLLKGGTNKGRIFGYKKTLDKYLSNEFPIQSNKLRKRLLKEGIFEHQCNCCKLTDWLNEPIPLELEHIDGNHFNNTLTNLELLCPNCHAKTSTYRGKNIGH